MVKIKNNFNDNLNFKNKKYSSFERVSITNLRSERLYRRLFRITNEITFKPLALSFEILFHRTIHLGAWLPLYNPYAYSLIYAYRRGFLILNASCIYFNLKLSVRIFVEMLSKRSRLLFIDIDDRENVMYKRKIRELNKQLGHFFVNSKWPSGLLSNFNKMYKLVLRRLSFSYKGVVHLQKNWETDLIYYYWHMTTQQRYLYLTIRQIMWMDLIEGLNGIRRIPEIIFIPSMSINIQPFKEATNLRLPLVIFSDGQVNNLGSFLVIPGNGDSIESLYFYRDFCYELIKLGYLKELHNFEFLLKGIFKRKKENRKKKINVHKTTW